jgi:hypothetical protein
VTVLWEWRAELEQLVAPVGLRGQTAHRIRYRAAGQTRWRSFLLIHEGAAAPPEAMVLRAIEEHAASRADRW